MLTEIYIYRLFKLYGFLDKAMSVLAPFTTNSWEFTCGNFKHLIQSLNKTDAEVSTRKLRNVIFILVEH